MSDGMEEIESTSLSPSENKFRRAVRAQSRVVNFLAIIGIPTVLGVWLGVTTPESVGAGIFWSALGTLILLQGALYTLTTLYAETVPELHIERSELQDTQDLMIEEIEGADEYIQWLEAANKLGNYWSTFQALIAKINPANDERFKDACRIAVQPMIDSGGVLFEFDYGEVWSVSVYEFNESSELLEPVWWDRPHDHPSQGVPRSWRSGDGHVGSAFMQDRILFTTDLSSDEAAMLLKPSTTNERDYDCDVYRSFVSAPILLDGNPEPQRFGVLVITSNEIGRFDDENKAIVGQAAQVLAQLFSWRKLEQSNQKGK